jgi:hypothetical protein
MRRSIGLAGRTPGNEIESCPPLANVEVHHVGAGLSDSQSEFVEANSRAGSEREPSVGVSQPGATETPEGIGEASLRPAEFAGEFFPREVRRVVVEKHAEGRAILVDLGVRGECGHARKLRARRRSV